MALERAPRTRGSYPLVVSLDGPVVIFGGGPVGLRKAEALATRASCLRLVSRDSVPVPSVVELTVAEVTGSSFSSHIPHDASLVVCAFDDAALNHLIAAYCREQRILVTNASDGADSTAVFPNVIEQDGMLLAVSAGGSCPLCSYALKRCILGTAPWLLPFGLLIGRIKDASYFDKALLEELYGDGALRDILSTGDIDSAVSHVEGTYGDS